MSLPPPLAPVACLPTELISYVLQQVHPAILIICGKRTAFLCALAETTSRPSSSHPRLDQKGERHSSSSASSHEPPHSQDEPSTLQLPLRHPLLVPTLQQISRSRHTNASFVCTVSHLRAYLSVLSAAPVPIPQQGPSGLEEPRANFPLLLVYGLVGLHRGTSEWSVQGLGSTVAALVDAGGRTGRRVVLVEEWALGNGVAEGRDGGEAGEADGDGDDGLRTLEIGGSGRERRREDIWHEKLPILSGSVRRAGADAEYGGRTVEVGMVLKRWFKFETRDWGNDDYL